MWCPCPGWIAHTVVSVTYIRVYFYCAFLIKWKAGCWVRGDPMISKDNKWKRHFYCFVKEKRIGNKKDSPGSMYFRFLARCVSCNGIYLVSALGGLFGAGGDVGAPGPKGHKNARCNSHPTSDIILAFLKYGVTSFRNFTVDCKVLILLFFECILLLWKITFSFVCNTFSEVDF